MAQMSTQQAILLALQINEGAYTYQIVARTKLDSKTISRKLSKMVKDEEIARSPDERGSYLYFLKSSNPPQAVAKSSTILDNEHYAAMWHRVAMLKRMRERTIEEYHPLLTAVIRDYEVFLRQKEDDE